MITASATAALFRVFLVASIALAPGCIVSGEADEPPPYVQDDLPPSQLTEPVRVVKVIDGDTVDVELSGGVIDRVRFKGVNTPELHPDPPEPFAQEARDFTFENIGTQVELVFDSGCPQPPLELCRDTTPSHRLLAYIRLSNGNDLGTELLSRGLAQIYIWDNEMFDKRTEYEQLQAQAQAAGLGIWSL